MYDQALASTTLANAAGKGHVFWGLPSSSYNSNVEELIVQLNTIDDEIEAQEDESSTRSIRGANKSKPQPQGSSKHSNIYNHLQSKRNEVLQQLEFCKALGVLVDRLIFDHPKVSIFTCNYQHDYFTQDGNWTNYF